MKQQTQKRSMLLLALCLVMTSIYAGNEAINEGEDLSNPLSGNNTETSFTQTVRDGDQGGESLAVQLGLNKKEDSSSVLTDIADRIQLHGYAQGQFIYQHASGKNANSFLCKRVLFWANANITDRWSFCFMHDFSAVVQEFYTDYRITKNNALTIRVGQFKNGLAYENALSPTVTELIDVYSEGVTWLTGCGSDPMNGVNYGRDQGVSLYGETNNKSLRYELQLMNGSGINMKDKNNQKDIIARLEFRPAKGVNLSATGQLGTGNALATTIINPEIKVGESYKRNRWTVGAEYKSTPFNIRGEYVSGIDGDVKSHGAYATGSVAIVPKKWDLIGSYEYFNFNTNLNQDMHKAVFGVQYWFFKRCRIQAQYVYKNADTNYSTFFNHTASHQILCQMQVRFN